MSATFDTYDDPRSQALLALGQQRFARDRTWSRRDVAEAVAAATLLAVATLLAAIAPSGRAFSAVALGVVAVAYLVARRVKFPVGSASTWPAQMVVVPMLLLLPLGWVPLTAVGLELLDLVTRPEEWRSPVSLRLRRAVSRIADTWFTVGSTGVLLLAGGIVFRWTDLATVAVAVFAGGTVDLLAGAIRTWLADGEVPSFGRHMLWLYLVDVALASVALPIAAAADGHPAVVLLELPALGLLGEFARERRQRLSATQTLERAYRGTVLLLGEVIESEDEYTGVHSQAVVELSLITARRLGLDAPARQRVEFGALLHDVGKIRIPKAILHKPGKLDEDEWAVMRRHTAIGEEMLRGIGGALADVGTVVRHTHERWDGNGYPDGLAGSAIPMESRIIAAADAFNAMTTDRPYRQAMSLEAAIAELDRCSGSQFDPAVVAALAVELTALARLTNASNPLSDVTGDTL